LGGRRIDSELLGHTLLQDYVAAFDKYAHDSAAYAAATFHLLVGQLPNIRDMKIYKGSGSWLDTRIHPCYFSPSATAKGEGANFVSRMAEALGLKYQPVTTITDAGLVGTINDEKEVEYGWLHQSKGINILAATEASVLLQDFPVKESRNVMDLLQVAMNTLGSKDSTIAKKIGFGDPIEFQPSASLLFTTYVPTNLTNIILQRGLLQRTYLTVNTVSIDARQRALERQYSNMVRDRSPDTTLQKKSIAERLKHINTHYAGKGKIAIDPRAEPLLVNFSKELFTAIRDSEPFLQEKLGEFVSRMAGHQIRIGAHFACLNEHEEIEPGDISLANIYTRFQFRDIIAFLEKKIRVPNEWKELFHQTERRVRTALESLHPLTDETTGFRWVDKRELVRAISRMHFVSEQTAVSYLDEAKDWRLIEIRNHKGLQKDLVRLVGS